jgi:hypothetical protein
VKPAMARFLGGLNREIQDILAYKEYTNITRLFHLACKAERQVQGRRASTRTNIFIGRNFSTQPCSSIPSTERAAAPYSSLARTAAPPSRDNPVNSAAKTTQKPATSTSSVASTGRTRMFSATAARDLDMSCVTAQASVFWSSKTPEN